MLIEDQTKVSNKEKFIKNFPYLENFIKQKLKERKDKQFHKKAKSIIETVYKNNICDLFSHVQIETISKCNGKCSFCPVNSFIDPRNSEFMSEELFFKIINELKKINYKGILSFFGNNEALLDKRLIDWIEKSRELLPSTVFSLYTNGTPLNLNKFLRLSNVLDELVINNYNDQGKLHLNIQEILEYLKNSNNKANHLIIRKRLENQIMNTRAGNSQTGLKSIKISATCTYPFHQINIVPDGNISLCCNDSYVEQIMGNVKTSSLVEIWNNQKYRELRNKILSTRQNIKICSSCDEMQNTEDYIHKESLIEKKYSLNEV